MVFNQLFLVYETMMIQCTVCTCRPTLIPCNGVDREINYILFYSILLYSILFYSILFYSILFYSILFYSILFYSILFYSILRVNALSIIIMKGYIKRIKIQVELIRFLTN